jgi:hypothetical protein
MKTKNFILLCIVAVLLVSCAGNKKDSPENASSITQEERSDLNVPVTEEQIRDFIEGTDILYPENLNIIFREIIDNMDDEDQRKMPLSFTSWMVVFEINFGLPNGKNWYALWYPYLESENSYSVAGGDERLFDFQTIFVINEYNEIIESHDLLIASPLSRLGKHDIFKKIPGIQYNNEPFVINDFNNDGLDEILFFTCAYLSSDQLNGDIPNYFYIENVDSIKNNPRILNNQPLLVRFDLIHGDKEFTPIEYCTMDGVTGFKIYTYFENKDSKWIFYTWDAEQRKYVEVVE